MPQYSAKDIVITIPVYKENLNSYEEVSFRQVCRVLNAYEIVIVCPQGISINNYASIAEEENISIKFEYSTKHFFEGIEGYNKLMLSPDFYERFSTFKYLLVYQLDCYVFRDELLSWANRNYDYVGAPWIFNDYREWSLLQKIRYGLKRFVIRYTNAPNNITTTYYKVGNGGLSLRKIKTFINVLEKYKDSPRLEKYKQGTEAILNEDVFWSREVNRYFPFLKIPNYKTGLDFAFDVNPQLCYDLNNNNLPFGCHAWQRYDLDFWSQFIEMKKG